MVACSNRRELDLIYCGFLAAIESSLFWLGDCCQESTPGDRDCPDPGGRHHGTNYGFDFGYQEAGTLDPGISGYSNITYEHSYGYRRNHECVFWQDHLNSAITYRIGDRKMEADHSFCMCDHFIYKIFY